MLWGALLAISLLLVAPRAEAKCTPYPSCDVSPPMVVFLTPLASSTLSGTASRILVRAVDVGSGVSIVRISLSRGGAAQTLYQRLGSGLDGDHEVLLDTVPYVGGSYTLLATAVDGLGRYRQVSRTVAIANQRPRPVVGPVRSFVDSAQGHSLDGNAVSFRNTTVQRVGDWLSFIYRTRDQRVFLRRWNVSTGSFEPAVRVFDQVGTANEGVHQYPSLLRTASGDLVALWPWGDPVDLSPGQRDLDFATWPRTMPPRLRLIPDPQRPATWSSEGPGLPLRDLGLMWSELELAYFADIMGVWDPGTGTTHALGEGGGLGPLDGTPIVRGLARTYYRILADRSMDGPYLLTRATAGVPPGADQPGNVFTKGKLALGKEIGGARSLHLVWSIRNTFEHAGVAYQHNYNLYYARSTDGGLVWKNFAGTRTRTRYQGMEWNDPAFLAYQGDLQGDSELSWDIDPVTGAPLFLIARYRPGSGAAEIFGHADSVSLREPEGQQTHAGVWDLLCLRWDGSAWQTLLVDDTTNYFLKQVHVAVASNGTLVAIREEPIAYNYSLTGGLLWSGWQTISSKGTNDRNHQIYVDPLHPNLAEITWGEANSFGSGWVEIQLVPDP